MLSQDRQFLTPFPLVLGFFLLSKGFLVIVKATLFQIEIQCSLYVLATVNIQGCLFSELVPCPHFFVSE